MEQAAPRVSICSQIRNQTEWAKEMIASVVAQTYPHWELIIVDDGSTENLRAVVESFADPRIQYHRFDENRGVPKGTNYALKRARGEFVGLIAADETISPKKLEEQLEYLDSHPGVDAVWGLPGRGPLGKRPEWEQHAQNSRAHNRSREAWLRTLINLENVPIGGASLLMRRSVMESLGYLDESLTLFSDHELYCRFFEKHVGVVLPYRWAIDKPITEDAVRVRSQAGAAQEHEYVKAKHPLILPPVGGKVTVGIPCYNQAKYLPDSVASVLAQTYQDLEIMILDDGSTDDFRTVVQQFTDQRIKVMAFPENMGVQEALNQMAFRAAGEFFVVLAADDTIEPTLIERCMAEFRHNPWLEFVATQTDFMTADRTPIVTPPNPLVEKLMAIQKPVNRTREDWLASLYGGNHYFGVGMYRTKAISEVGGWGKEFKVLSDYEMYLKLLMRENIQIIEEPLTHTRVHGENYSMLRNSLEGESQKKGWSHEELALLYHNARKPYYRPMMKVIIATPFYELKGFSPYIDSLAATLRLLTAVGINWNFMQLSGDSYVHRARNTICDAFLRDPEATDLFFVDSDMSWNPEAFVKMCMLPDEVVGAAYPVKNNWENWTSVPRQHIEDGKAHLRGRPLGDGTALVEAQVLAGGFLRIKRSALEKFRDAYPDLWYIEPSTDKERPDHRFTAFFGAESVNHQFYGEDHMFSLRLRNMGIPMFIYPNVDITHWGYKDFGGNYDAFLKGRKTAETAVEKAH
ncbi:MAG TPA: glycosyltransferase [Dehalococcoidia bacterium]|nr:glycosyltransferase [Dehalococcoidia bacterium]